MHFITYLISQPVLLALINDRNEMVFKFWTNSHLSSFKSHRAINGNTNNDWFLYWGIGFILRENRIISSIFQINEEIENCPHLMFTLLMGMYDQA